MGNKFRTILLQDIEIFISSLPFDDQDKISGAIEALSDKKFGSVYIRQLKGDIKELKVKKYRLIFFIHEEIVDEIIERKNGTKFIKARILTTDNRYKKMLIGTQGRKIKEIGSYARKEIALAVGKKVFLDLTVQTDPHWQKTYY